MISLLLRYLKYDSLKQKSSQSWAFKICKCKTPGNHLKKMGRVISLYKCKTPVLLEVVKH